MKPDHLWNLLVGTTTIEPSMGAPTRISRRPMPTRLAELLSLPEEQWTPDDRLLVHSVRDLASVLMRGPLLQSEGAAMGMGIGVTKELMVCLAAFAQPVAPSNAGAADKAQSHTDSLEAMLSSLKVL